MRKNSKRRKDLLIDTVTHGPFSAEVRMDDNGVFHCAYGSQSQSGPLPVIRKWAWQMLREVSQLKWEPVMQVSFDDRDDRVNNLKNSSNIACYMERMHIAWDGEKWIQCPWVVMPPGSYMCCGPNDSEMNQDDYTMKPEDLMAERIRRSQEFVANPGVPNISWPLIRDGCGDKVYYIRYSEERWQTMIGILDKIRELRGGINRLLSTEKGWLQLAVVAQTRLLGEGEHEK